MTRAAGASCEVNLDLWGNHVRVRTHTHQDHARIGYYFRSYLSSWQAHADLDVDLQALDHPFVDDPDAARRVRFKIHGDDRWHRRVPPGATLLPPLGLPGLVQPGATLHASCAAPPGTARALVVHGQSTAGKSSLLMELLDRGWGFIGDDLCLVDEHSRIVPFTRPVGLRERARSTFSHLLVNPASGMEFETTTGSTLAVHPSDIHCKVIARPLPWGWTVLLRPARDFLVERLGATTARIHLSIDSHCAQAADAVEQLCVRNGNT